MNLGDTIRGGIRWVVTGKLAKQLLQFIFSIILARLLMPSDFGLLVTVQIFTGVAGFIAGGGMGQAIVQSKTLEARDTYVVFTAQLAICCIIYAIFFITSPAIAAWFSEPLYEDLMRVSALTFLIRPFANLPHSLLHREMRYKAQAFIGLGVLLTTGITSMSLALLGFGVWSLALGGIAGGIVSAILATISTGWRPNFALDIKVLERYANYGFKVSMNDIVVYFRNQSSNFTVSRFIGTEAVGLFNKASSLNDMPLGLLSGSAYKVIFRAMSKVQDNLGESKYLYLRALTLVSTYTLPFYIGLWWTADSFIVNAYGQHWADTAPILKILVLTALLRIINNQSGAVLAARKLLGRELVIQLISWAILILAIMVGYHWGTVGIAWAVVAAFIPYVFLIARLACRELRVTAIELWSALSPALVLNTMLFFALWATDTQLLSWGLDKQSPLYLVAMVFTGGLAYGAAFLFLPIPSLQKEVERWKSRLRISR